MLFQQLWNSTINNNSSIKQVSNFAIH